MNTVVLNADDIRSMIGDRSEYMCWRAYDVVANKIGTEDFIEINWTECICQYMGVLLGRMLDCPANLIVNSEKGYAFGDCIVDSHIKQLWDEYCDSGPSFVVSRRTLLNELLKFVEPHDTLTLRIARDA